MMSLSRCLLFSLALSASPLLAQKPDTLPAPRKADPVAVKAPAAKPETPKPLPVVAAEPELVGATTFDYLAEFKVRNVPQGTALIWDVYPDDAAVTIRIIKTEKACLVAGTPRQYKIRVRMVKGEDVNQLEKTFTITGGQKIDPKIDPKPVDPKPVDPTPSIAPIPDPGFRVLIAYQDTAKNKMTASQRAILGGAEVRDYLEAKTVLGPDGKTKEYRIWDVDIKGIENESKLWQTAWARQHPVVALVPDPANPSAKREVPTLWLLISNGKEGYEGPILPTTSVAEVMALLRKYGG